MKRLSIADFDSNCKHNFTKQSKMNFSVLRRVCTNCGTTDIVTECDELDEQTLLKMSEKME